MTARLSPSLIAIQIAACLGFLVVHLDVSVVNVALVPLKIAFDTDLNGLEWIINSYALVFSALLILGGALGDKFGARTIFVFGFATFTLASVGCGMAPSMAVLIVMRLLQGIGAAMLLPTSLTIIRVSFKDTRQRASAVAIWGACGGLALAAGPVLGGLMIQHLGWSSVFFLNIPIGVAAIALISRCAPPSPLVEQKLDIQGQIVSASCLAALTYALTESSNGGWTATPLLALSVAALLGALFIRIEKTASFPMLPERLSTNRTLVTASLCGAVINMTFYGTVFALSIYYQTLLHYGALQTGIAFIPLTAVLTVSTIASSRVARSVSPGNIITFGFLLQSLGFLALSRLTLTTSAWWLDASLMLIGIGSAVSVPSITNAMLSAVSKEDAGMASGLMASARQVGGVIGVALFGALISSKDPEAFMGGMAHAMLISCGTLLAIIPLIRRMQLPSHAAQASRQTR
jgi:DHA2 family methylenomycin A resistance protein-like MFS transporter